MSIDNDDSNNKYIVEKEIEKRILDIPVEEIEEYKRAFEMFDKDNSGTISAKEFIKVLKNLGQNVTKEEADNIIQDLDTDGSGEIDFEEFITYMQKIKVQEEIDEEDAVIKAFQTFDADKSGTISMEEFRHILCDLGQDRFSTEECNEIFKEADLNNDGILNYKEFINYWKEK